jgi:hypothetical protein
MASWIVSSIGLALIGATSFNLPEVYVVPSHLAPGQPGTGQWRPAGTQVSAAREALRRYLNDASVPERNMWERAGREDVRAKYDSYILQMEGVRRSVGKRLFETQGNGPKQIHIGGFCPEIAHTTRDRIKREPLLITDGGSCIFQAMYDLESKQITFFAVNGVA